MSLPNFSVRRPVTIIMFFLGIGLFGLISWSRLPQELYPPITYPQLSVVTFYKDAAPEEMEILITKSVEEAVGTVSGVRRISSTSKEETSLVIAEFNWGTNMDFAALGVREKIDLIKESLPRGSEDPIVIKYNPFELPLMVLNITADKMPASELTETVKKVIKNEIEKADGVAACNITGAMIPEIAVEIDQDRLISKNLGLNEVVEALSKANLDYPAGTIEESFYEYLIRTIGEFKLVEEVDDVVVGSDDRARRREYSEFGPEDVKEKEESAAMNKRLILLKEIGRVKDGFKEKASISRYNRKDNISLSVQKQADTNTLKVANSVKEVISRLKKTLPKKIHINIVYDQSVFVKSAINGVKDAALQGGILAFLVLLLFLRNVKSAAIVALNIPVSILAVFSFMYLSGLTINMISLGGLALGVGMLVDNGIVVIENIYRQREEEGKSAKDASISGANEVSGAIAGSTLTTVAVFFPMIFVIGIAGQLFKELAFTVTFALLTSLVAALTLIPILSCRVRSIPDVTGQQDKSVSGAVLGFLQKFMHKILVFFLNNKIISLGAVVLIFVGACLLIPALDTEFLPKVDQGQFIIRLNLPPGTRLEVTNSVSQTIESYLFEMKDVESVTVNIGSTKEKKGTALLETMGPNEARIIVNLKPLARFSKAGDKYRQTPTPEVLQKLKNIIKPKDVLGAKIEYLLQESVFKSAFQSEAPIVIEIKGQDLNILRRATSDVEAKLRTIPGIYSVRNTLIDPAPEVKVNIFKDKASGYNLSASEIAVTAQTAIKGFIATKFKREGEEIDIRVCLKKQDRDNMARVRTLGIHSPLGIIVPLSEVAYFSTGKGPTEIKRLDQERVALVTANIFKRSFKQVSAIITEMLSKINMPSGYSVELTGENEQINESFNSLRMALILSVILVFMIMASQFESLWQPFVIMFTIPLSLIGVILILLLTHTPISVMVILGIIILGGIVVNNGIVLIDYTNILRREGLSAYDALITASRRRLRPIIMTALTTILGLVPLAFALNEGAELQQPMAIAVIGGLAISTFLSLIVIPTVYLGMDDMIMFIRRKFFGKKPETGTGQEGRLSSGAAAQPKEEIKEPEPKQDKIDYQQYLAEPKEDIKEPQAEQDKTEQEQPRPEEPEEKPVELEKDAEEIEPKEPQQPLEIKPQGDTSKEEEPEAKEEPEQNKISPEDIESARGNIDIALWDSLSLRQKELIKHLRDKGQITRKEYSEIFNISVPTASRDLKTLFNKGVLSAEGPAAVGRCYKLNKNI